MKYIPQRPPLGRLTVAATSCWFVGFQSLLESSPTPFDLTQIGRWLPSIWYHKFVNKCVIEIGVIWNHKLLAGNAVGTTMDSFLVTDSYWYVIDPWFKRPMVCQARPPMSMTRSEQWWLAEENKRNFSWDDLQRWSPIIPSPYYPLISNPPWLPRWFWKLHPVVCWSSVILAPARMDNKKCFKTPTAPTHLGNRRIQTAGLIWGRRRSAKRTFSRAPQCFSHRCCDVKMATKNRDVSGC